MAKLLRSDHYPSTSTFLTTSSMSAQRGGVEERTTQIRPTECGRESGRGGGGGPYGESRGWADLRHGRDDDVRGDWSDHPSESLAGDTARLLYAAFTTTRTRTSIGRRKVTPTVSHSDRNGHSSWTLTPQSASKSQPGQLPLFPSHLIHNVVNRSLFAEKGGHCRSRARGVPRRHLACQDGMVGGYIRGPSR